MTLRLLPFALALILTGCFPAIGGVGGGHVGCDFRNGSVNGPEDRCQDREGIDASSFATTCEQLDGEVVEGGCDLTGIVGGCDISAGSTVTTVIDYFYAPTTEADAMADCDSDGGTWVP